MSRKDFYYHASPVEGLTRLEPRISNHGVPLVYLSGKRENVLVYLSNAVEKYCTDTGFAYTGQWHKWGPYGFDKDGRIRLEEYYPYALESTYRGVSGYIYSVDDITDSGYELNIPDAVTSSVAVSVCGTEYVPDAYEEILKAEKSGLICITRFDELTDNKKSWLKKVIAEEYDQAGAHPEYRYFLRNKFPEYTFDEIQN